MTETNDNNRHLELDIPGASTQEILNRLVEAGLTEALKKSFGRSFTLRARGEGDWLQIQATEQDSGNEYMTVHDLACLLQTDIASVRRMTNVRSQRQSKFPVPFFKINGRALRFDRKKIQEWLHNIANSTPTFRSPKKQKRGRPRKTRIQ